MAIYSFIVSADNQFDSVVYYKMSIYISHLYVELDINVSVASFDVIFSEKLVIGKSLDFLWIFVFIQEESGLDCGLELGCEMGESIDFSGV